MLDTTCMYLYLTITIEFEYDTTTNVAFSKEFIKLLQMIFEAPTREH